MFHRPGTDNVSEEFLFAWGSNQHKEGIAVSEFVSHNGEELIVRELAGAGAVPENFATGLRIDEIVGELKETNRLVRVVDRQGLLNEGTEAGWCGDRFADVSKTRTLTVEGDLWLFRLSDVVAHECDTVVVGGPISGEKLIVRPNPCQDRSQVSVRVGGEKKRQ